MKQVIGCGHPCKSCLNRGSKRSERPIFLKTFYKSTMADNSFIHSFSRPTYFPEFRLTGVC